MVRTAAWAFLVSTVCLGPALAGFTGQLDLGPNPADASGRTKVLLHDFGYEDSRGVGWEAAKGNVTDGASIPGIFKPIIGGSFTKEFVRAAVIHDHYCDRAVRTWRQTHRVFYDILREDGVSRAKAAAMYYAILIGGPKWGQLIKGESCNGTQMCVRSREKDRVIGRGELYDDPKVIADSESFRRLAEKNGDDLSAEDVEEAAAERNPADPYLNGTTEEPPAGTPLER